MKKISESKIRMHRSMDYNKYTHMNIHTLKKFDYKTLVNNFKNLKI